MKKLSGLSVVLCLLLVLQMLSVPAFAAEADETEQTQEPQSDTVTVPEADYGTATVLSGCRTLNGQTPLAASEWMMDTAQAAFVYEENTGTVLYAYNPDTTLSPGALTKILTAIVAIENGSLSDEVTISTANYGTLPSGAINAQLKNGEVMTLEDLLHCLILKMANDAAISIAEHIAGSESAFVEMMNALAQSIGCTGTVFANCHGTSSAGQYTTARDLTRIIQYAMKNSQFRELFGETSYTVPATNKSDERELTTNNYLLEQLNVTKFIDDRVTGGLATYTSSSGASIAFTAEKEESGLSYIMVILGAKREYTEKGNVKSYGNFEEAYDLLEFAFDGYEVRQLLHDGQSLSQFSVANGENQVVGQSHTSMDALLPKGTTTKNLILKYSVAGGGLTAPISQDQQIATLQIWYRNSCVAETELYAMSSVHVAGDSGLEVQGATRNDSNLSGVLSFIGIVCLIILVPFVIYLVINNVRRTIARNRRRRRRRSRRRSR